MHFWTLFTLARNQTMLHLSFCHTIVISQTQLLQFIRYTVKCKAKLTECSTWNTALTTTVFGSVGDINITGQTGAFYFVLIFKNNFQSSFTANAEMSNTLHKTSIHPFSMFPATMCFWVNVANSLFNIVFKFLQAAWVIWESTHVLPMNIPCSHLHSFFANGMSNGLVVSQGMLEECITWRRTYFWFYFCTVLYDCCSVAFQIIHLYTLCGRHNAQHSVIIQEKLHIFWRLQQFFRAFVKWW